jgi:hypothetical protein
VQTTCDPFTKTRDGRNNRATRSPAPTWGFGALLISLMIVWLAGTAPEATAEETYLYVGNSFVTFSDTGSPFGPYSVNNWVTVEATFDAPLAPNLVDQDFNPYSLGSTTTMVISDNLFFIDSEPPCSGDEQCSGLFTLSTDESGNITEWYAQASVLVFAQGSAAGAGISTRHQNAAVPAALDSAGSGVVNGGVATGEVEGMPGTWTMLPEPSASASILTGMAWMYFAQRRKCRSRGRRIGVGTSRFA